MQVRVKGQLAGIQKEVSKTSGRSYRSFQLVQQTSGGKVFLVRGRCFDDSKELKAGVSVELDGAVSCFKFKDGTVGMTFDMFAPKQ